MNLAATIWSVAWAVVAAAGCASLLRASRPPEHFVKNGYRWLAVATFCLAAGAIVQGAFGGLIGGAQPLRIADLISLAALPALVIGLATLTSEIGVSEPAPAGHGQLLREPQATPQAAHPPGIAVDICLLVSSLFVICLVTMFGPAYATADAGRAAFTLALVRPVADLVALGMVLPSALRSLRLTLLPVLALVAVCVGDSLAVGNRIAGGVPGTAARAALLVALLLLALAPAAARTRTGLAGLLTARSGSPELWSLARDGSWSSPATIAALGSAAAAAFIVTGFSLGGGSVPAPLLAVSCSLIVVLLVARLAWLARGASVAAASAHESDWMFRSLADTTSDAVMICDLQGTIEYVSHATAEFGYSPGDLTGRRLADLVHPEDRPAGIRAAITGLRSAAGTATFTGRVRGADGSWRYVESTLSRYGAAGEPVRLLITSRDVSDRVALRRQVTQLIFHDGLTGLPNRAYVEELVKDLAAEQDGPGRLPSQGDADAPDAPDGQGGQERVLGAILIELAGHSAMNDLVGSAGSDLLLAQAARRLRTAVPPPATVARWGSDQFAVFVATATTAEEIIDLAESLAGQIAAEPFAVAGKAIAMTASVGVATVGWEAADQVLTNAGIALSRAREAGGQVEIYTDEMYEQSRRRAELVDELRQAIAEGALDIEYEPIAELATSQVQAVAARVCWHRGDETIGPDELPGIAAESGMVSRLGEWVLLQACRKVAAWRNGGWEVGLSVRCARRHVTARRFAASVLTALDQSGLPPQALTLEVAERALIDTAGPEADDLAGLRGKGIRLAISSFGTGYGSLAYLRRLAVDAVKIDSSFVAGLETDATLALLTRTIVRLADDLGLEVIAEGICRPGQRAELVAMGCGFGQGPAIGPAIEASQTRLP
jgi:PAS domain S-box-containing protein/diguanylate cyclase (GGDEF)-like protein